MSDDMPLLGRQAELRTIFSRLATGQSAALVGEPNTGKSILMDQVANPEVRAEWLPHPERFAVVYFNGRKLFPELTPHLFWQRFFQELEKSQSHAIQKAAEKFVKKKNFGGFSLNQFFRELRSEGLRVALLVDHIGHFLSRPQLIEPQFLGTLRSLSSRSGSLVLLFAGRRRLSELNQQTARLNPLGSPFFNTLQEIRLGALTKNETRQVLVQNFGANAKETVLPVTGRHPYLIYQAIKAHPSPIQTSTVLSVLTSAADEHFGLAFRFLGPLSDVLLGTLGYILVERRSALGDLDELVWRGWLEKDRNEFRSASLLLSQWLEKNYGHETSKIRL